MEVVNIEDHKSTSEELIEDHKSTPEELIEDHKSTPEELIEDHKSTSEELIEELKLWGNNEKRAIHKEKTLNRNMSFAFSGMGDLGEELTLYIFRNSIGSASKGGMAFDNKEVDVDGKIVMAREVKTVCKEGTKECKKCKSKCPRFQPKCISCENTTDFKLIGDSRAGISAKAHIKYKKIILEYIIWVVKYDEPNEIINLTCHKFLSSNNYFNNYIENQHNNSTSDTCNLLPYSYDWFLSGAIKIIDIDINISSEPIVNVKYYDINSNTPDDVPITIFSKTLVKEYNITEELTTYENIIIKNIQLKNKQFNKDRGKVTRK
jgi:hypothetical protein